MSIRRDIWFLILIIIFLIIFDYVNFPEIDNKDIGPSPYKRRVHTMSSANDSRRVFVLGGESSPDVQADEAKLIHVLDTSMYFLFVVLFGQRSSLKQSSSFTRNPT